MRQGPPVISNFASYYAYWGKARGGWHLLPLHCLDVAAAGVTLLDRAPRFRRTLLTLTDLEEGELRNLVGFFCALHDLGKFSPAFQWQVPEVAQALGVPKTAQPYDVRHDSIGWVLWDQLFAKRFTPDPSVVDKVKIWLRCATGHHGQPPSKRSGAKLVRPKAYFTDTDLTAAAEWVETACCLFQPQLDVGTESRLRDASWWLAGFFTLADWLGSSIEWFPYQSTPVPIVEYWHRTVQQAEVAVAESGLGFTWGRRGFRDLFPAYAPTPMQALADTLATNAPYFLAIEESTGGGKTEAALAASGGTALYFGLPTMATANGLWERVGSLGGQQALVHAKRWLVPESMVRAAAWLTDSARLAMMSSVGVGTVDQAMLAVLHTRFSALRLIGLAGRTLIIDEVHAYDPYMKQVLEVLVELHARAGGSVILLSATLPFQHRLDYADAWARGQHMSPQTLSKREFPLLTFVSDTVTKEITTATYRSRTVVIERESDVDAVIARITTAVACGHCVAWIRNTVAEALDGWERLRRNDIRADLFHARFTVGDRLVIERRVLQTFGKHSTPDARAGKVLVATQVVEQSLDLDFDLVITDLAPIDLLIQRAGRLHRHDRGDRGVARLVVHGPKANSDPMADWVRVWSRGTAAVYPDHGRLWLSDHLLGDRIDLPHDARRLIEGLYGPNVVIPNGLADVTAKAERANSVKGLKGFSAAINPKSGYEDDGSLRWDEEMALTRLGDPTQEWVLCESGEPLNGDVPNSVVALPSRKLRAAQEVIGLKVGPWRKAVNLESGVAHGVDCYERKVEVRYGRDFGLKTRAE